MTRTAPGTIDSIYFDPKSILMRESGILLDSHYLGSLHAELDGELGANNSETTLFQMGFLHGLDDANRAVTDAFESNHGVPKKLVGPAFAFRFCAEDAAAAGAAINLQGVWPERTEASARLAALGQPLHPICFLSAGYTSGWLSGTFDADILVLETACSACGADSCSFIAREASAWRECQDPNIQRFLDTLPFNEFRNFVQSSTAPQRPASANSDSDYCDPSSSVVHIWGPVMVVPFSNANDTLSAVQLIGNDPAACDVSVVVVDFTDVIVDDGFGGAALEQIIELIEAWGAEAIFASVSPLSEAVVADLERQPLFIHKDLSQAIAAGFQIANSQRSPA